MDKPDATLEETLAQLQELVNRHRYPQARALLGTALTQFPDDVELLSYSMWVDWQADELDSARATIGRILELDPEHYRAHYVLANIHLEEENYAAAEKELIELLRDYPEDASLYSIYARVMLLTFNFEKAEKLAQEALRLEPEHEGALQIAALSAYIMQPGEESRKRVSDLMERYPDQFGTVALLTQMLIDRGRHREAYELVCELVRVEPGNQPLVDLAVELKASTHWSMKPLWPMQRFGWGGAIVIWVVIVALLRGDVLGSAGLGHLSMPLGIAFLVYVVYSWVWPPILKKALG